MKQFYFSLLLVSVIFICSPFQQVSAQHQIDEALLQRLYNNNQFSELYKKAFEYRKYPYSTTFMIDFYIAVSSYMINEPKQGKEWFAYIMQNYHLDSQSKNYVLSAEKACIANRKPSLGTMDAGIAYRTTNENAVRPFAGVSGKTMAYNDYEIVEQPSVSVVRTIPTSTILKRIIRTTNTTLLNERLAELKSKYYTQVQGTFILLSDISLSDASVSAIAKKLSKAYSFYQSSYSAQASPYYLYVFIGSTKDALNKFALDYHGLSLPPQMYGYTQVEDLCLAGVASERFNGTLFHELFHLTARNSHGDIIPFLDEGIAALYEASYFDEMGNLKGTNNWRQKIIKDNIQRLPSIERLVTMNWDSFQGENEYEIKNKLLAQAKNEATARYFMLYLQEKGKLAKAYATLCALNMGDMPTYTNETLTSARIKVLENILGVSSYEIDTLFLAWLKEYLSINTGVQNNDGQLQIMQQTTSPSPKFIKK